VPPLLYLPPDAGCRHYGVSSSQTGLPRDLWPTRSKPIRQNCARRRSLEGLPGASRRQVRRHPVTVWHAAGGQHREHGSGDAPAGRGPRRRSRLGNPPKIPPTAAPRIERTPVRLNRGWPRASANSAVIVVRRKSARRHADRQRHQFLGPAAHDLAESEIPWGGVFDHVAIAMAGARRCARTPNTPVPARPRPPGPPSRAESADRLD
jgi:hypothetical protein